MVLMYLRKMLLYKRQRSARLPLHLSGAAFAGFLACSGKNCYRAWPVLWFGFQISRPSSARDNPLYPVTGSHIALKSYPTSRNRKAILSTCARIRIVTCSSVCFGTVPVFSNGNTAARVTQPQSPSCLLIKNYHGIVTEKLD